MLVKLTVEWPKTDERYTIAEIEDVGALAEAMLKLNAIRVTIEKVEEGE